MTLNLLVGWLKTANERRDTNGNYIGPPFSIEEIHQDFKGTINSLYSFAGIIENYEIVSNALPLFRKYLIKGIGEMSEAYRDLADTLPFLCVTDDGIIDPNNLLFPDSEDMALLEGKFAAFDCCAWEISSYVYDIKVEMQNCLLGSLFENKVSIRVPEDDRIVLTSTNQEMIRRIKKELE